MFYSSKKKIFRFFLKSRICQASKVSPEFMCNLLLSISLMKLIMNFLSLEFHATVLGQTTAGKMSNPLSVTLESILIALLEMVESAGGIMGKIKTTMFIKLNFILLSEVREKMWLMVIKKAITGMVLLLPIQPTMPTGVTLKRGFVEDVGHCTVTIRNIRKIISTLTTPFSQWRIATTTSLTGKIYKKSVLTQIIENKFNSPRIVLVASLKLINSQKLKKNYKLKSK